MQRYAGNMHKLTKLSIAIAVFILGLGITWSQTQKKLVSKRFRKTPKGMWE